MGKPISVDLRQRVCQAVLEGLSCRQAATRFKISASSAIRWVAQQNAVALLRLVRKAVIESPAVLKRRLCSFAAGPPRGRRSRWRSCRLCSQPAVWTWALAHCGASSTAGRSASKKTAHAAEQERADVAAARETWFAAQIDLDPDKLVFIDETGANTKMTRLRGRAARGERCRAPVPFDCKTACKSFQIPWVNSVQ